MKPETSPDYRILNAIAVDALQQARGMPPGAQRTNAPMELILLIVVLVLLFGGGGYWGRRRGHW